MGPNGAQMCVNGKCRSLKNGYTIDTLASSSYQPMNEKAATEIAALHGVAAAAGGLLLTDNRTTISQNPSPPTSFSVDGTDISQQKLGPLSDAVTKTGRTFKPADANKNVAVVDANYATSNGLKTGGTITIGGTKFTIIGTVTQPEGSNPPNVYIPLARAQSLAEQGPAGGSLKNDVNTVYVTAASAADIPAVQNEIAKLLPSATVTTPSSLANEVTGSVSSAAKLADDLGKWLSVLVLIAAFTVAVLLTMLAVSRRVREFGTLKALGWRGRADHRPGDGGVVRPRRARRRDRGGPRLRRGGDHQRDRAEPVGDAHPAHRRAHHDAKRAAEPDVQPHRLGAAGRVGQRRGHPRRRGARRGRRPAGRNVRELAHRPCCARRTHYRRWDDGRCTS